MKLNDGKYGYETEELSMELDLDNFLITDRIWMMRNMDFKTIDLRKHSKKNHFKQSA